MSLVWLVCITVFYALPFELLAQPLSWSGVLGQTSFLLAFNFGALLITTPQPMRLATLVRRIDSKSCERLLTFGSILALLCLTMDASHKEVFNLAESYQSRSVTAQALQTGQASASSLWFQLGFLLYPAGYVFAAVHILYSRRLNLARLLLFGAAPIAMATLVMGGRMPVLYFVLLFFLSLRERRRNAQVVPVQRTGVASTLRRVFAALTVIFVAYYFIAVFLVRADSVGGASVMFNIAEESWGIGFRGPMSDGLFSVLGEKPTYLLFVFVWYIVQGFVIGNHIFSLYDHSYQFGVYGIDLMSAVMRRLAPDSLADGFSALLDIGAYGFFPSAWGSLYVDFGLAGAALCACWGMLAGLVYRRIVIEQQHDWVLLGPFVTIGIVLSTINTPIGLANGLMIYAWLLFAFLLLRRSGMLLREST